MFGQGRFWRVVGGRRRTSSPNLSKCRGGFWSSGRSTMCCWKTDPTRIRSSPLALRGRGWSEVQDKREACIVTSAGKFTVERGGAVSPTTDYVWKIYGGMCTSTGTASHHFIVQRGGIVSTAATMAALASLRTARCGGASSLRCFLCSIDWEKIESVSVSPTSNLFGTRRWASSTTLHNRAQTANI